jgi:putative nucleotidyltransferase-like protein
MTGAKIGQDDRALLSLGCLSTKIPAREAIDELRHIPPQEAAEFFRRHKVRILVDRKLAEESAPTASVLRTAISDQVRAVSKRLELVPEIVGQLDNAGRELGVCVVGIKGLAAREYYQDLMVRDLGDWDVYVESEREAWALTGWLRHQGYDYDKNELPWFKSDLKSGKLYGQVRIQRQIEGVTAFVDIHFGGYSVRHCGLFRVRIPAQEHGWRVIDRTQNMVMSVANAAGDQFITAKDLNDLSLALDEPSLDWDSIREGIKSVGLQGFFDNMLRLLLEVGDLNGDAILQARSLAFAEVTEPLPPIWEPDEKQRRLVTRRHAFAQGRQKSLLRGLVAAGTAARYYNADLSLRLVRRRGGKLPRFRPWTCVRLVPVSLAAQLSGPGRRSSSSLMATRRAQATRTALCPSGAIQRVRTANGDLVEAAEDLFLPTVYYRLSSTLVRTGVELEQRCMT